MIFTDRAAIFVALVEVDLNKTLKWLLEIGAMLLVVLAIWAWQERDLLETDGSQQIQSLVLPQLSGETFRLTETDKPTLIYFFAPWCQVCHLSIDNLQYLDSQKVRILTVAMDYSSKQEVQGFLAEHEFDAPVLMGTEQQKAQFKLKAYPTYYLLDRQLRVVSKNMGYSTAMGLKLRSVFNRDNT